MYDFLCLSPHGTGSISLTNYLNQHRFVHVAAFFDDEKSDILSYERFVRPWTRVVGYATKDYHIPAIAKKNLEAARRILLIQTTRDPIEALISLANWRVFASRFWPLFYGRAKQEIDVDAVITSILEKYVKPHAAELAYEADTFKRHVIIDVSELRGAGAERVVRELWLALCGDADIRNQLSNHFAPLGSPRYHYLSKFHMGLDVGEFHVDLFGIPDKELRVGAYDHERNIFISRDCRLHTYADINTLLPSLGLTGQLHMCTNHTQWFTLHPKSHPIILEQAIPAFEKQMRRFDMAFAESQRESNFLFESIPLAQREIIKVEISRDFQEFKKRHPEVADRWSVTRSYLGI